MILKNLLRVNSITKRTKPDSMRVEKSFTTLVKKEEERYKKEIKPGLKITTTRLKQLVNSGEINIESMSMH